MLPLEHIQMLFNARAKNDQNSSTLAQTLETNIYTAFKGDHKFIFELLQNADDSCRDEKPIAVDFILAKTSTAQYLIFSHTGAHFSVQDVEKICDNSQQFFQDKSSDSGKIGYKGIGFKAVFSISDCVHVISGDYHFRFDQNYFLGLKKERSAYPWPIIPIPSKITDLPLELQTIIQKRQVNFVLKLRAEVNIEDEMRFIEENRVLMLFLKNVHSITLKSNMISSTFRVEQLDKYHKQFFVDEKLVDEWVIQDYMVDIPDPTRLFLSNLQDSECPQRLKIAKQTKIIFAARAQNKILIPYRTNQIFSYLPTQINCGFSYVVNGDFLLNTERTRLVDNHWNAFLFDLIGYFQLKFLANLSAEFDTQEIQTFKLLPERTTSNLNITIEKAYQAGFARGTQEIAFVPSLRKPRQLIKVSDVIIDNTGFYENFNDFEFHEGKLVICSDIVKNKFISLFQNKIKKQIHLHDIWNHLESFVRQYPNLETQRYLLNFLTKQADYQIRDYMKEKKVIFSEQAQLCAPNELYFPIKTVSGIPGVTELNLVHQDLLEFLPILKKIGVRQASRIEFIRRFIKPDLLNKKIRIESMMDIVRLLFEAMRAGEFEEEDWCYLKKLSIKTKKGELKSASDCYLSNEYHPDLCLESELPEIDIFVSTEYARSAEEYNLWKQFFKKIGVMDDLKVQYEPRISVACALERKAKMKNYLEEVSKTVPYPLDFHEIQNFLDFDLWGYASLTTFSPIFWKSLIANWYKIEKYGKSGYHTNRYYYEFKKTYLQFCLGEYVSLPAQDGKHYAVKQLFMPALRECIGSALPVAHLSITMTEEQADFFGFKTKLTVDDCLKILDYINQVETRKNPGRYVSVLKYLLNISLTSTDQNVLKKWSGQLLSKNNTLQPVKKLQHAFNTLIEPPADQNWLKPLSGMTDGEMISVAKLFDIPIVSVESIRVLEGEVNANCSNRAREQVLQKLSVMALMEAHHDNTDSEEVLGSLMLKLEKLSFVSVKSLRIEFANSTIITPAYLHQNVIYFEKNHDHVLTKSAFCKMISIYFKLANISSDSLETYLYLDNVSDLETFFQRKKLDIAQLPKAPKYASSISPVGIYPESVIRETLASEALLSNFSSATSHVSQNLGLQLELLQGQFKGNIAMVRFENKNFVERQKREPLMNSKDEGDLNPKRFKMRDEDDLAVSFDVDFLNKKNEPEIESIDSIGTKDRLAIGRRGEAIVYEKLKAHYTQKYSQCQLEETRQGFKLVGHYLNQKTEKFEPLHLEIFWSNKGLPVGQDNSVGSDLTICKNGVSRYVEVKASASESSLFSITACEWKKMESMQNLYRIFRVINVGSDRPAILKIKNPFQKIQEGSIEIKSYYVKMD